MARRVADELRRLANLLDSGRETAGLPAFELLKPLPGRPAGVVFVHDANDSVKGSIANGCLKLAWNNGNCQGGWCGESHVLPGQLATKSEWFKPVRNKGEFHL